MNGGLKQYNRFTKKSEYKRPLVSIITVCLNSALHIEDTIKSIIEQTYDNVEYIIVDGGSTDATIDIIKKYEEYIACWISEPDRGIYDAMNKGISLSTGDLVGIINSDDWYSRYALEWVVQAFCDYPQIDVVHGDLAVIAREDSWQSRLHLEEQGKYSIRKGSHDNMLINGGVKHPTCFVRRYHYDHHLFQIQFPVAADYDFLLSLYSAGKKFYYLEKILAYFRRTGISQQMQYRQVWELFKIRKKFSFPIALQYLLVETKVYMQGLLYLQRAKFQKNR